MQVGLEGEEKLIYTEQGSEQAEWEPLLGYLNKPLTWYKVIINDHFAA